MAGRGMKILGGLVVAVAAVGVIGYGVVMNVPAVQDTIMKRTIAQRLATSGPAALLDDGALHVFLCGTGSPMPDMTRANACSAIMAGGHMVIIDTGPGSWRRIAEARLPAAKIDTILLTHLHSDHIGDLGEFATQSWIAGRSTPLDVRGPTALPEPAADTDSQGKSFGTSSTEDVVKGFALAYNSDAAFRILHHGADHLIPDGADMVGHNIVTPDYNVLQPVYERDGLKISAFLVDHTPIKPAYGYRVEYNGRVAVFSGDTAKTESVERFSKDADLLVHEALNKEMVQMIVNGVTTSGNPRLGDMAHDTLDYHASPVEAAEIANAAGVKLLVYSHVVPPLPNAIAERMFMRGVDAVQGDADVKIGYDGMLITMPAGSDKVEVSKLP